MNATGYLDFSWPSISNVDGYFFRVYKNETFVSTLNVPSNNHRVSGLVEGDSVRGTVYPYKSDNVFPTGINVPPQSIDVTNFNLDNKTFSFGDFFLNQKPLTLVNVNSGHYGTGSYNDGFASLAFELINPRDTGVLKNISSEPFLSGIEHKIYSDGTLVSSQDLSAFDLQIKNDFATRNIQSQIIVNDFYGSSITGNIHIVDTPISIRSLKISTTKRADQSIDLNIIPEYSSTAQKVELVTFTDNTYSNYTTSGIFNSFNNFKVNFPLDTSGHLRLTPYDWFGSGHTFNYPSPIYYSSTVYRELKLSKIHNPKILKFAESGAMRFSADIAKNSDSGSYFTFSLDSSKSESFNSNSYITGTIPTLESGVDFDYFNQRTGSHLDFFANLNLYRSGSNILEDQVQLSGAFPFPKFQESGIEFNYALGQTNMYIKTIPASTFTGVDVMVSGHDDLNFNLLTGDIYSNNLISSNVKFKITKANEPENIFDSLSLHPSGLLPVANLSEADFSDPDGFQTIKVSSPNASFGVNSYYNVYRKKTFKRKSANIFSGLSGILDFEDYTGHFLKTLYGIGNHQLSAPSSVSRNNTYISTGYSLTGSSDTDRLYFTGHYESGLYYSYRILPVNGYGSGDPSNTVLLKFPINNFTNAIDSSLSVAESDIETLDAGVVKTSGDQNIGGDKTFIDNIISNNAPVDSGHLANKHYVDHSYNPIHTTYSQINTGVNLITGHHLYLSNILMSGYIIIDDFSGEHSPTSFFYPIECTGLSFEKVGQGSYYIL